MADKTEEPLATPVLTITLRGRVYVLADDVARTIDLFGESEDMDTRYRARRLARNFRELARLTDRV